MTTIFCTYSGDGETKLVHGPTGSEIATDLPPDNGGKGRCFSPTDLLASAFASCVLTIMGKMASSRGESFEGAKIAIDKVMAEKPRRVKEFNLKVTFPSHFTQEQKDFYIRAVHTCPVHQTLHPDVQINITVD